jgi:ATP-dependent RNA helicase RhlE
MPFAALGLSADLTAALETAGYTEPTPIQAQAIPLALAGHDLLGAAQTGTGKTAAFVLPMLERLRGKTPRKVRALVVTPTRELAAQVYESVKRYGAQSQIKSVAIFGGVGMQPQIDALRRGVDVLICTPGRLLDHLERRTVDLRHIEICVLDEADRMLDMGFLPAMKRLIAALPKDRQTLMFSATFSDEIKALAAQFQRAPIEVSVTPKNSTAVRVQHAAHPVDGARKRDALLEILSHDSREQTLLFCRTKHGADKLAKTLQHAGHRVAVIHGNRSQAQRTKALADFKAGSITVLVATDIAARGIDIAQLPKVINYDLPSVAEDYVHRIGRTGRAGADGRALSLVTREELKGFRDIEKLIRQTIALEPLPGFEPVGAFTPQKAPPKPARGPRRVEARAPAKPGHAPAARRRSRGPKPAQRRSP